MIKKVIHYKEVGSTQDTAKRFVSQGEEAAIVAQRQKRGRGRQGRPWLSPPGGLYLSLILFPHMHMTSIPLLASLVIVKLLEEYGFVKLSILWPNDVFLEGKKVCGIICEQYKKAVICGIGLNINNEKVPKSLDQATSLNLVSGHRYDLDEILNSLIRIFNQLYGELQSEGIEIKEVLNYCAGLGETVELVTAKGIVRGIVHDIDEDWALILRDETGMLKKYYYGDVRRLVW